MTTHRPYIDAVGAAVQDHGVPIVTSVVARIAGRAEALLRVDPRITASTFAGAANADLRWDEEHGWRCVVAYQPHTGSADSVIEAGVENLATAPVVAAWFVAVLAKHGWAGADPTPATPVTPAAPVTPVTPAAAATGGTPAIPVAPVAPIGQPAVEYADVAA